MKSHRFVFVDHTCEQSRDTAKFRRSLFFFQAFFLQFLQLQPTWMDSYLSCISTVGLNVTYFM